MSKITIYPELFLEEIELNRMIKFLDVSGFRNLFVKFTETFGIIKKASDTSFIALQVYNSSSGKIGVKTGSAFTGAGDLINLAVDTPDLFTLTDDNIFRKVFIQYAQTQIETGTLALNANGTIVGTGTVFTELFKTGKRIEIINSVLGNNKTCGIVSVTSDTSLATDTTFIIESGLNFKVKGVFTPSISIPDGSSRPYFIDTVNITLEADTAVSTNDKIYLARVKLATGVITCQSKYVFSNSKGKCFFAW